MSSQTQLEKSDPFAPHPDHMQIVREKFPSTLPEIVQVHKILPNLDVPEDARLVATHLDDLIKTSSKIDLLSTCNACSTYNKIKYSIQHLSHADEKNFNSLKKTYNLMKKSLYSLNEIQPIYSPEKTKEKLKKCITSSDDTVENRESTINDMMECYSDSIPLNDATELDALCLKARIQVIWGKHLIRKYLYDIYIAETKEAPIPGLVNVFCHL